MLRLEYLATPRSRAWKRSSLSMHPEGLAEMKRTAAALKIQEGWDRWRIVSD